MTAEALEAFAALRWPGAWFVADAAPSGRLAVLYALALGARSGHDYVGCEHLVAGAVRAGGLGPAGATADELRRVAVAAVAGSQLLAGVTPDRVDEWFADEAAADPGVALAAIRLLPTITPRADGGLRRARGQAAASASIEGAGAVHVLSGVLADPGTVARHAADLGPARLVAERRASWGPLLDLLDDLA
ncbi:MAG TPA: Clp protease N-terminal domain-containing protein [Acidimicrobiales bacterium]|nr:Clp protease N-terminal domain-containing protein [Acidimicrobiales bacterium]